LGSGNFIGGGNALSNTITSNSGIDTLIGGGGTDTYIVNNSADVVTDSSGFGTVLSSVDFDLSQQAVNAANLTLQGASNLHATGNNLSNVITGNSGDNILTDGLNISGFDTLIGGLGNDTYILHNNGDVITENLSEGTDLVQLASDFTGTYILGANVEDLIMLGSGNINATGNSVVNTITGNSGNNILQSGATGGGDKLIGGGGTDTYVLGNSSDTIIDNGLGTIQSSATYDLSTQAANIKYLTLIGGSNINATGNSLDNVIIGNNAVNTIVGGLGVDTLTGAGGADAFRFNTPSEGGDTITDFVSNSDYFVFPKNGGAFVHLAPLGPVIDPQDLVLNYANQTSISHFIYQVQADGLGHIAQTLYYDADANGPGAGVAIATLIGVNSIVFSDIHLV
jgi:Ca2+-binding RTX toxin-like protein